jgi:HAE1 family hydrophobic/amphiphilic exporter-1
MRVARFGSGTSRRSRDTFSNAEVLTTLNGERAALLSISKTPSDDTLRVMDALRAFLDDEGPRLPEGVALTITGDTSGVLVDRLTMLARNAIAGLVLVFAAMWLFFGFRQAFWITAGLPVSFLGAIAAMAALGYSLNMLTMVGLLIVIGILMDDAIVIGENIASQRATACPPSMRRSRASPRWRPAFWRPSRPRRSSSDRSPSFRAISASFCASSPWS